MPTIDANAAVDRNTAAFFYLVNRRTRFSLFLLKKLPAAYFSGLRIEEANEERCLVSVPYRWFTQNPFRSVYFACLSMAAEMSTGLLAMANIYKRKPAVSMLVVEMRSKFYKKATGVTIFTCSAGMEIKECIQAAIDSKEPKTITVQSSGRNEGGEIVAECWFTWSFKAK
jgi:hypothetical protein